MRKLTFFYLCFLICSCGNKTELKVLQGIDIAQSLLSEGKCRDAIDLLEDLGRQNDNAVYLQVLASAYSCRAGLNAINFITQDIPNIQTNSINELLTSLSILSYSNETSTDSSAYTDIGRALSILLDAGASTQPSQSARQQTFGARKSGDMGMQILILSIVQLGKFLNHYGNVNNSGHKGLGTTNSNKCFLSYSYAPAQAVVTAAPAPSGRSKSCVNFTSGHPDLSLTLNTALTNRRLCEGLMLITNIIDVLDNLDISGNSTFSDLQDIATFAKQVKDTAINMDSSLETLLEMTSQSQCVSTLNSLTERENMQLIYALFFEAGLQ